MLLKVSELAHDHFYPYSFGHSQSYDQVQSQWDGDICPLPIGLEWILGNSNPHIFVRNSFTQVPAYLHLSKLIPITLLFGTIVPLS